MTLDKRGEEKGEHPERLETKYKIHARFFFKSHEVNNLQQPRMQMQYLYLG